MDIKNHEQTAHAPSTLEKIRKVKQGSKLSNQAKTFGSTYRKRNCSGGHEGMRVAGSKNLELRRSEPLCLTSRGLKPY